MKNIDTSIQVVSPFTHLSGHYWPYTVDMACALAPHVSNLAIHATLPPRESSVFAQDLVQWKSCCGWSKSLCSLKYRNINWGGKIDRLMCNLEFYLSLKSAMAAANTEKDTHIYCIESCHRILLREVLKSRHSFSTLCVGHCNPSFGDIYKQAFDTGRLKFIVETEAVRKSWEPLAGEQVVHIPAAIPQRMTSSTNRQEARKRLGLPSDAFICLFFGTHREGKDYHTAIAAAHASKSKPYLLFVGPLISGNNPETLLTELNYTNALALNQYYPDEGLGELFDSCDVIMLPYADNYTKGSAVLMQACQYGKPVIASDSGLFSDFVGKHKTGLLYTPEDIHSLSDCYDTISNSKTLMSEFNERISATRHEYSWDTLTVKYLQIFQSKT